MALKKEEKQIDGKRVEVTELPARFKLMYSLKLATILPPVLKEISGIVKALEGATGESIKEGNLQSLLETDLTNLDFSSLGNAIEGILKVMEPEEFFAFLEKFFAFTYVDGSNAGDNFDGVFEGEFALIFKVFFFTIQANNFLGKGLSGTPQAVQ